MHNGFGIAASLLGMAGGIPYIYNTYRRKTKPHTVAWLIFLILSVISFASQFILGARASLFFIGWTVIMNIVIVGLSLRKKAGFSDVSLVNIVALSLAIASIILWKTTNSALIALICVLIADGIGALLIVIKAYKHPHTETAIMWSVGIFAGALNIAAVGSLRWDLLAAPIQLANLI